jgi:hypothetical protein
MTLAFGQPDDALVQYAYVVADIDQAMADFTARLGLGPWHLRDHFVPPAGRYLGRPTRPLFSLARAFSGHAMIELIVQHDDTPSVYHPDPAVRRYGFHHWARFTRGFDAEVARLQADGWTEAYYDELPSGSRVMYLDPGGLLPGMLELVEHTDVQEARYTQIYRTAIDWDGSDPVRQEA